MEAAADTAHSFIRSLLIDPAALNTGVIGQAEILAAACNYGLSVIDLNHGAPRVGKRCRNSTSHRSRADNRHALNLRLFGTRGNAVYFPGFALREKNVAQRETFLACQRLVRQSRFHRRALGERQSSSLDGVHHERLCRSSPECPRMDTQR